MQKKGNFPGWCALKCKQNISAFCRCSRGSSNIFFTIFIEKTHMDSDFVEEPY